MPKQQPENTQQIEIPARLVERVERRVPHTTFDDAGEYIAYVVEEILAQVEDHADEKFDNNNDEELEARLKSLGYLED